MTQKKLYDTKKNYMTLKKIIGHEKLYELISMDRHLMSLKTNLERCLVIIFFAFVLRLPL